MQTMRRAVLAIVLVGGAVACRDSRVTTTGASTAPAVTSQVPGPAGTAGTTTVTTAPAAPTTAAPTTTAPPISTPAPPAPPPPPPPPAPADLLRPGDEGPAVAQLQQRLAALGYWLGSADGVYGSGTTHAVVAFQKATGLARDGVAGPATSAALAGAARLRPASTSGHVVEVDLRRQLVIVADGGHATAILDTSTGAVAGTTPVGHFQVQRQVDGYDTGPYGALYRPKYFYGGVAIHGYSSVPPTPASHGCVRVTNAAIDMLWATGALPIGGAVWVY